MFRVGLIEFLLAIAVYWFATSFAGRENTTASQHGAAGFVHALLSQGFWHILSANYSGNNPPTLELVLAVKFLVDFVIGILIARLIYGIEVATGWKIAVAIAAYFLCSILFWKWAFS